MTAWDDPALSAVRGRSKVIALGRRPLIGDPDLPITATAIQDDLTRGTRHLRHLRRVPGRRLTQFP